MINRLRLQKITKKLFCLMLFGIFCYPAFAKELGIVGSVYPIAETDLIQQLQTTLQQAIEKGDLARWRSQQETALQAAADRPPSVPGLRPVLRTQQRLIDPSFTVPVDVRDANGHLLLAAGSRWNPLKHVHWMSTLIFFDGDNPQQVAWAVGLDQQLKGRDRLILVNGSLQETTRHFQRENNVNKTPRLYFDQGGRLTQRLEITQVPAMVEQVGERLKITEAAV